MSIYSLLRNFPSLLWVSALLCSSPLYAVSANNPTGLTGSLTSSSAEIMNRGSMRFFGMLGVDEYYDAVSGNGERETHALAGLAFGLSDKLEAGIAISGAHNSALLATGYGLRYLRGQAKYQFYGSRTKGSAAAVSVYSTTAELTATPGLASGKGNSGAELIYSKLGLERDTTYTLSLEQRDYKTYNAGSFSYTNVPVLSLTASKLFRTNLNRNYELGLRMENAAVNNISYGNTYLSLAAHFSTDQELNYLFGALIDVAGGEGPNKSHYIIGFAYTRKHPSKLGQRISVPSRLSDMPDPLTSALKKPDTKARKKPAKPVVRGCQAQIEIMDLSDSSGLAEQLSARLKKDGYCIRAIHKEANSHAYYSHLYYGLEKGEMAVGMAKKYKIQGEVSRRRLPSDVDIRFILGKDQR